MTGKSELATRLLHMNMRQWEIFLEGTAPYQKRTVDIVTLGNQDSAKPRTLIIKPQTLELFSLLSLYRTMAAKELCQGREELRDQMVC